MSKATTTKVSEPRTTETPTMKIELKEIPKDFQRSITENLRTSRTCSEKGDDE